MHLVRHDDLRIRLAVSLTTLKPTVKKHAGLTSQSQEAVLEEIMRILRPYVIVAPDMVPNAHRQGVFGKDEPHPFPDLVDEQGVPKIPGSRPGPAGGG